MRPKVKSRIPAFKSIQVEAEWWDTHDLTDYWDELTPVKNPFYGKPVTHSIIVPLDAQSISKLERRAKKEGIPFASLARSWIEERLRSA